jgi:sRNA-binding carbon storage regulator CsrA
MLILTRREGETLHLGEASAMLDHEDGTIMATFARITPQSVAIELTLPEHLPLTFCGAPVRHSGFARIYLHRGEQLEIGSDISLLVCNKDRSPSQVAIGIAAPKQIQILRGELLTRMARDAARGRVAA